MTLVLDYLKRLNRKERFHLLKEALGADTFSLDCRFRDRLQALLVSRLPKTGIPQDAFVAMDYHMDWIQMALYLADHNRDFLDDDDNETSIPYSKDDPKHCLFQANQQDIDLLIAFSNMATTHIVMVEAKAETGWTNKQLQEKMTRLRSIFGETGDKNSLVVLHLVLISPKKSKQICTDNWPNWARGRGKEQYLWLPLHLPPFIQVSRYKTSPDLDSYDCLKIKKK